MHEVKIGLKVVYTYTYMTKQMLLRCVTEHLCSDDSLARTS
jgi:hypothetical protein